MKLADALIQALVDHGVQQVFGVPGDFALPLFKALDESRRLPLYLLSHEPGVGFAADAAARIASAPSAAFVRYGAGARATRTACLTLPADATAGHVRR
jgi:indolepyruvate decarboxylase